MNAVSQVAARRELTPIEALKSTVARKADDFKSVLPSHISFDKFQRTIATAVLGNPKLLECDRQSLLVAAIKLAQDGLLPDGREAALVPFKTRVKEGTQWFDKWLVQPMPMAWGLRKKVLQSGEVVSLQVGVVYGVEVLENHFIYEIGMEPPIRHRPKLDLSEEEMSDDNLVAAYSIARIKNGEGGEPYWSVEIMRRSEVLKVRQMSQTGAVSKTTRDGKKIEPKGPWVDWQAEMWKKTVLRRHTKVLPMSSDLLDTLERDAAEEARAEGAARMLATEPAPAEIAPPTRDEVAQVEHDPDTGEITEDAARDLDRQGFAAMEGRDGDNANDGTLDEQNPAAAEGPADEQRGEDFVHPGTLIANELVDRYKRAKIVGDVVMADGDLKKHRAAMLDDDVARVDEARATANEKFAR